MSAVSGLDTICDRLLETAPDRTLLAVTDDRAAEFGREFELAFKLLPTSWFSCSECVGVGGPPAEYGDKSE